VAALVPILAVFALRLFLIRRHAFDPDEFQHLHGAWCIAKGLVPYRDYFDHHTPWLHFFLAPFLAFFSVDTSPAAAESFIVLARAWMWAFAGLALALTYVLGRSWEGPAVGWTATLLLSTSVMFLDKTLEVRPDVPAVAFLIGSWAALLRGVRSPDPGTRAWVGFAESGFLLGVALLCTQKALFVLPATGAWLAWYVLERGEASRAERLRHAFVHAGAVLAPILVILAVFAAQHALGAFVESNLLVNLRWPVRFSAEPRLRMLWSDNRLLVLLAFAGLAVASVRLLREPPPRAGRALVPLQALGLGVGAFVIPVPTAQYFVMLLPLAALLAAGTVVELMRSAARLPAPRARVAAVVAAVAVVVAFSVRPMRIIAGILQPGHTKVQDQLDRLRYVLTHTDPRDTVLDGFSGLGVFRPHAYFYYFLHDEIRTLLAGRGLGRLLTELRDGTVAPDFVVADRDVLELPAEVTAFLRDNYVPAGMPPLWVRRVRWLDDAGGWLDLGEGPTDALAGRGWSAPERDATRTFRRARGRRSTVRLPVRQPGACRQLLVHARALGAPATVQLAINGRSLGVLRLSAEWADQPVALAGAGLRRGVNTLELTYDASDPSAAPIAVDGLQLQCGRGSGESRPAPNATGGR
jgi:hypothetical protein